MNAQLIKAIAEELYGGDVNKAKDFLKSSKYVLDVVSNVIETRLDSLERAESNYDSPSWAYKQAHYNGKREALLEVVGLLQVKG